MSGQLARLAAAIETLQSELPDARRSMFGWALAPRRTVHVEASDRVGYYGDPSEKCPVTVWGAATAEGARILATLVDHRLRCTDAHGHEAIQQEFERAVRETIDGLARQLARGVADWIMPRVTVVHEPETRQVRLLESGR